MLGNRQEKKTIRKNVLLLCCVLWVLPVCSIGQSLISFPESAAFDTVSNRYFISNQGSGTIVQVDSNWNYSYFSTGLTTPKGLKILGDTLFVAASTDALLGFDLNTGERIVNVQFPGQVDLNDIEADTAGNIYVSDPQGNQVHKLRLSDLSPSTIVTGITMANGLLFDEVHNRLLVCQWIQNSPISAIDLETYSVTPVVNDGLDLLDGLTEDNEGNIYVSSFGMDNIYKYDANLHSPPEVASENHIDPGDIFYNKRDDILVVPNVNGNSVDFVLMTPFAVIPDIRADPMTGHAPLTVQFTDESKVIHPLTSWAWDFDNDGHIDSQQQNPNWTYENPGIYSVQFAASNETRTKVLSREDYISVFSGESALWFHDHNSYAEAPAAPSLNLIDTFTIETWIHPSGWGPFGFLGLGKVVDKKNISIQLIDSYLSYHHHSLLLQLIHDDNSVSNSNTPENSIGLDEWQHIAVTYDDQNVVTIFINGVEQPISQATPPSGDVKDNSRDGLYIGNDASSGSTFDGLIDEVRIWNVLRTGEEIRENRDFYLSGTESGLVGYWKMNEGNGDTLQDHSWNGNDGIVVDADWREGVHLNPAVVDGDEDGILDSEDNCPEDFNPEQEDGDGDAVGDTCDNCPHDINPAQADADNDAIGDVCDSCTDTDDDGYGDPGYPANTCEEDNCPDVSNPDQTSVEKGDINCEGGINVLDVLATVNHILGTAPLLGSPLDRADCNNDNNVNILDALGIINVILGIGECAPSFKPKVTPEVLRFCESLEPYLSPEEYIRFATIVNDMGQIPVAYHLSQNYPNPFNSCTTIHYTIPNTEHRAQGRGLGGDSELSAHRTSLTIYNILGQEVRTLVDTVHGPGYYSVAWNGRDEYGSKVGSGVYVYCLTVGDFSFTRRMLLLK